MSNSQNSMAVEKIIFIQNIITSYRVDLFNQIHCQTKKLNVNFEVFYYKESYSGRYLPYEKANIIYSHRVFNGFFLCVKSNNLHFNPSLLWKISRLNRSVKVIMGSSWNDINVILILVMKRMGLISCDLLLWSEANFMTKGARKKGRLKEFLRGFVFNSVDKGVVIPGVIARETILDKWGYQNKLYYLPNLLNGEYYHGGRKQNSNGLMNLVTVARLEEVDKGILNFIKRAGRKALSKFNWVIAGDGPDKQKIQSLIERFGLDKQIVLVGNIPKESIRSLYKRSDVFLLPSLSDPNPLTVVEALHAGLPIMLSKRCGNVFEAVEDEVNGKVFDPCSDESIRCALQFFVDKKKSINMLSKESRRIAEKNFNLKRGVYEFLMHLKELDSK